MNQQDMMEGVSIIVTCHNLEEYLDDCIDSVKGQTVQPCEVVLCHDACDKPKAYADITTVIRDRHLDVASIKVSYNAMGVRKRRIVNAFLYIALVAIPLLTFILFRLYVVGQFKWW